MPDDLKLLTNHKQWNARPAHGIDNGTEIHGKWVNCYDSIKEWSPINCELSQVLSGFEVSDAPFYFKAPKRSTGYWEFNVNNRFDVFKKTEINAPEFSQVIRGLGINDVPGELFDIGGNGRLDSVLYPKAYNSDFVGDLVLFPEHGKAPRLKKLIKFDTAPIDDISIEFEIEFSGKPELSPRKLNHGEIREEERDKWATNLGKGEYLYLNSQEGIYIRAWEEPLKVGAGIKTPMIWDSNPDLSLRKSQIIETYIKWISGNKYILTKIIPNSFFDGAVFPVYTDTTSTFFPDPNPETTSVDGSVRRDNDGSWANARNTAAALTVTANSVSTNCNNSTSAGNYTVRRNIFLFDTSSMPDADIINSADFSLWVDAIMDTDSAGLALTQSDPNQNVGLIVGDYDEVSDTLNNPTEGAPRRSYASMSTNQYEPFVLDATGLGWIDKAGITKFGTRGTLDVDDITPIGNGNSAQVFNADQPGTNNDPKLVVIHGGVGGIINQFQGPNLGADLFNGAII